ncbi:MAG: 5-(carboxyamino)imidazole ribonucleotide synthase [Firmicutes bacterium]|nr:5-(carboxyamino)imidazole ribonucleotide synthase [Bacillota bacterium]
MTGRPAAADAGAAGSDGRARRAARAETAAFFGPGSTIGILGGGQLGRMTAMAARRMGYRIAVLDPTPDSPAAQVADSAVVAAFDDVTAARKLASQADVVTYEFENVAAAVAHALERETVVRPASSVLRAAQDRIREKQTFRALGLPVTDFYPVETWPELVQAVEVIGFPCVLKTATGGYDGKGQHWIEGPGDLDRAWERLGTPAGPGTGRLILEAAVPFVKELSVIVARNARGAIAAFPVTENVHHRHILHASIVPARVDEAHADEARRLAVRLAEELQAVGVLGVEMFLTGDGRLFVNEFAPRPHNSGHYTLDACATSQFEQHVRTVCNLPLGSVELLHPAVMINVLGQHVGPLLAATDKLLAIDGVHLHLYGKKGARRDRKMGHITTVGRSLSAAFERAQRAWEIIRGPGDPPAVAGDSRGGLL